MISICNDLKNRQLDMSTAIQKKNKAALSKKAVEESEAAENNGDKVGKTILIDAMRYLKNNRAALLTLQNYNNLWSPLESLEYWSRL